MILELRGITVCFGGLTALREVGLAVGSGEILGLIGPNGAGKTTLFDCVSGVHRPAAGTCWFDGHDITGLPPYRVARLGLARTHQIVRPLEALTVRENVMVGACFGREGHGLSAAAGIADEVLTELAFSVRPDVLAGSLNLAQKKRLELARAVAARPRLLLLDEVLAGLNTAEITAMLDIIRLIRARGITIVMIEHIMHAVMSVSDRVVVLNHGEIIADGLPAAVAADPTVVEAYLGSPALAAELLETED